MAESIGRAVLGAAALEKILLVDIAQRSVHRNGMRDELDRELTLLERRPAGDLLAKLRQLGIPEDLGERIGEVLRRRNQLVHHFLANPDVIAALNTGDGFEPFVDQVDQLAADCQGLIDEIGPLAFSGAQQALGATLPELAEAVLSIDPDSVEDEKLRAQLETAKTWGQYVVDEESDLLPK